MRKVVLVLALTIVTIASVAAVLPASESRVPDEHTEWVAKSLKEMESIKVGMTRGDLLKVFREEGGISTRAWRRYAYRDCPYIKVDVEFEPVGEPENKLNQDPEDRIVKISKPFLEWAILD